jgi:type I restriction enzyme S subunit
MTNDELPEGWLEAVFDELNTFKSQTIDPSSYPEEVFELYSVPTFPTRKPEVLAGSVIGSTKQVVEPGDVLVCKINPRINRVWKVMPKTDKRQIASSEWIVMRTNGMNSEFLRTYFSSQEFREILCEDLTGVGGSLTRAQPKRVAKFRVPIAPLAEQKRIADKLEAVLGRVDACRARLDRVPDLLKRFRQSVLTAATSGQLTEDWREENLPTETAPDYLKRICALRQKTWASKQRDGSSRKYPKPDEMVQAELPPVPDSWIWASADALSAQVTDGEHIQPPYQDHGFPMLSAKHIRDGFVDPEGAGLISEEAFTKALARCRPENGDLTIVSVGATTGRTAIVENCPPFAIVRSVLLVKPLISSRYLLRWFQSPWCFKYMTAASGSSAQAHLYIKDTKRLPVPLPPPDEQAEIVRRVEALFALADRIEARLTAARAQVERLTPATLSKAFCGDLVPQDPNDEPASKLLERLQSAPAPKTSRKR